MVRNGILCGTNSLAARAAVVPNVPASAAALVEALARAQLANLGAGDTLVVAVVPLLDVVGDLDAGGALEAHA